MRLTPFIVISLLLVSQLSVAAQFKGAEYFINIVQNETPGATRIELQKLGWFGISDTKLYDVIEQKLLEENSYAIGNIRNPWGAAANSVKSVSWLVRALAYSGNNKYLKTLNMIVESQSTSPLMKKNAKKAIKQLPNYQRYNKFISNDSYNNDALTQEENNFIKMLRSDDTFLVDVVARRVFYRRHYNPVLMEELAATIKRNYKKDPDDRIFTSTMRWAVKALGYSRDEKYLPLLDEVEQSASRRAVRGEASRAKESFYNLKDSSNDPFVI